jgi:hypothetical protein
MSKKGYLDTISCDEWVNMPPDFPDFKNVSGFEGYDYYEVNHWFSKHNIPKRYHDDKGCMLLALNLEEITYLIDRLDGGSKKDNELATILSEQSLYQAITPEEKDTYTVVYSADKRYYYINEFAGRVQQWFPLHSNEGDEVLPFVFWKIREGERSELPKDHGLVKVYTARL